MDNLPQEIQSTTISSVKPKQILVIGFSIILIALIVISGLWFYRQYFSRETKAVHNLNSLITLIQNPDQALVAACNPKPHLLKQDQELIVYGDRELPDPNKYQEQKFTKPGLVDVRDSLTQGDRAKASEQLTTLWRQVTNSVGCFDSSGKPSTEKKDRIFWNPEQVNTLDVQRKFIPSTAVVGWYVSKIKEEAAKQFLKLWYGLNK